MIEVILDSSIINHDRAFLSGDFLLLKKLAELRLIQLHIPWVVLNEVITRSVNDRFDAIKQVAKQLEVLNRLGNLKKRNADLLRMTNAVKKIEKSCIDGVNRYWEVFIKTAKVVVDGIAPADGYEVMCSYFAGKSPFSKQKSRQDIPDAFIYESVKRISEKMSAVFVCADDQLRTSCSDLHGITCCASIRKFYELHSVRAVITEYEKSIKFHDGIRFITSHKVDILRQAKEDILGDLLVQFNYDGIKSKYIPEAGGILTNVLEPIKIIVMTSKCKYVDGTFYVPISVKCRFEVEYYLHKDLYLIYKSRAIRINEEDWREGDDYCIKEIFDTTFHYDYQLKEEEIHEKTLKLVTDERVYDLTMKPIMLKGMK